MKKLIPIIVLAVVLGSSAALAQLRLTALFDGPLDGEVFDGQPRGSELYADSDIADLSIFGLGVSNQVPGKEGMDFSFDPISASAGEFIYLSYETTNFNNFFGFNPDITNNTLRQVRGVFAVELYKNGSVIDVFGDIIVQAAGSDPWEFTDSWVYRKDETGLDGTIFVIDNWILPGKNDLDDETSNETSQTPVPIGTFSPGEIAQDQTAGAGHTPEPSTYGIIFSIFAVGLVVWRNRARRQA